MPFNPVNSLSKSYTTYLGIQMCSKNTFLTLEMAL